MSNGDDFFMRMCREAQQDLASGNKSWREIDTNTLFLACFGMLYNHLATKIVKPLWFFSGSVAAAVVTYIIRQLLGIRS